MKIMSFSSALLWLGLICFFFSSLIPTYSLSPWPSSDQTLFSLNCSDITVQAAASTNSNTYVCISSLNVLSDSLQFVLASIIRFNWNGTSNISFNSTFLGWSMCDDLMIQNESSVVISGTFFGKSLVSSTGEKSITAQSKLPVNNIFKAQFNVSHGLEITDLNSLTDCRMSINQSTKTRPEKSRFNPTTKKTDISFQVGYGHCDSSEEATDPPSNFYPLVSGGYVLNPINLTSFSVISPDLSELLHLNVTVLIASPSDAIPLHITGLKSNQTTGQLILIGNLIANTILTLLTASGNSSTLNCTVASVSSTCGFFVVVNIASKKFVSKPTIITNSRLASVMMFSNVSWILGNFFSDSSVNCATKSGVPQLFLQEISSSGALLNVSCTSNLPKLLVAAALVDCQTYIVALAVTHQTLTKSLLAFYFNNPDLPELPTPSSMPIKSSISAASPASPTSPAPDPTRSTGLVTSPAAASPPSGISNLGLSFINLLVLGSIFVSVVCVVGYFLYFTSKRKEREKGRPGHYPPQMASASSTQFDTELQEVEHF